MTNGTLMQEYEEEDLDALLDGNSSQLEDSLMDIDSILQPLSDSQQALEADLDLKDKEIQDQLATQAEEKAVISEQEQLERKHYVVPSLIKRRPPGLSAFQGDSNLLFTFEDLSLEKDFGWSGRKRLEESGLTACFVDTLINGKDKFMMVRYLSPETGQSNIIASEEDFVCVVDYIFYLCSICEDPLSFSVLSKCLFDLLKNSGYPWYINPSHLLVALLNLGARPQLFMNESFYEVNHLSRPILPRFYQARNVTVREKGLRTEKSLSSSKKRYILTNLFELVSDLLRIPHRTQVSEDKTSVLVLIYLAAISGQDHCIIDDPLVVIQISSLIDILTSYIVSETDTQDLAELLSAGFFPNQLSNDITSTWSYDELPSHMGSAGHNHPHNMLAVCSMMPPHSTVRNLICYLYIQLVLGVSDVDLPGLVTVTDLAELLDRHKVLWKSICKENHYCAWTLFSLIDLIVEGDTETLKKGSKEFESQKQLLGIVEQYLNRANDKDPLNLDPVIVCDRVRQIQSRWTLAVNKAENIFSMKACTGQGESSKNMSENILFRDQRFDLP